MAIKKAKAKQVVTARTARARHRPHLIDACISALHLYGPSKTTVDKVVAIAGLSPGIVRFYFDSKDALLVASLEFLASEFEQTLVVPVAAQVGDPIAALNLLVDLYLGPELASARKVSVWYSFWGEASSRQEYYDICGSRDAKFEALVHVLTRRLLAREPASVAEPEAIALGLIGTLEMLWQGFAFQTEAAIDRAAVRRQMDSYLRSVFPTSFVHQRLTTNRRLQTIPGWSFAGTVADLAMPGQAIGVDRQGDSILVVRGTDDQIRAFANRCPVRPHGLLLDSKRQMLRRIECRIHGVAFDLNGANFDAAYQHLPSRRCVITEGLVWVTDDETSPPPSPAIAAVIRDTPLSLSRVVDVNVTADWTVLVDLWRGNNATHDRSTSLGRIPSWSQDRFERLTSELDPGLQIWVEPHQILDLGPAGLTVTAILPRGPGQARVRQWRYDRLENPQRTKILRYLINRNFKHSLVVAASIQRGIDDDALAPTRRDEIS